MRDILAKLKPNRFEDLIALVALYRPGPMDDIPTYISVKNGQEKPDYLHPSLKGILEETYGIMVYQEQVMQIAQVLSGYSLGGADLLRRAMGKKIQSEMDAQRANFVDGAAQEQRRGGARLDDLRQGGEVRGLRLQQVPFRALRAGRLPDGLSQGQLSGRVLRRVDDPRHGQCRQDRQLPPRAGAPADPAAAARRQQVDGRVRRRDDARGQEGRALCAGRHQGRRPRRHGPAGRGARAPTARSRTCSTSPSGSTSG